MEEVTKGRKIRAAIGLILILAFTANSTVIISVMNPQLLVGMQTDLMTLSVAMIIATALAFIGSFAGARLIDKITPGRSMLVGVIGITIVLAAIGFSSSIPEWYLANVINGIVLAIGAFAAAAGVTAEFFGDRTRSAFGIIGGVSTFVTSIIVILEAQLLSFMDYHQIFFVLAGISLVVGLISVFVLIGITPLQKARKLAKTGQVNISAENLLESEAIEQDGGSQSGLTLQQALKTASFFLFLIAMLLTAFPGNVANIYGTVFFTQNGLDESTATMLIGLLTMVMSFTMMGAGIVAEKKGGRVTVAFVFLGYLLGTVLLLVWADTGAMPAAYLGIIFISFIAPAALLPGILIPELFGMRDYTSINAVSMGAFYLGVTIMMLVFSAITESMGVNAAFLLVGIIAAIALVLFLLAYATRKKKLQA